MFKKLCALFRRKKATAQPKPEHRPTRGPIARQDIQRSQARRSDSDDILINPLHPLNPVNPIYADRDDDCRRRSHEPSHNSHCSSSSRSSSSDSSSNSSSDSGSSSSSSSD